MNQYRRSMLARRCGGVGEGCGREGGDGGWVGIADVMGTAVSCSRRHQVEPGSVESRHGDVIGAGFGEDGLKNTTLCSAEQATKKVK